MKNEFTHSDEGWSQAEEEERRWQETLANDPFYLEWLKKLEQQRADDAGRRADALIETGSTPC